MDLSDHGHIAAADGFKGLLDGIHRGGLGKLGVHQVPKNISEKIISDRGKKSD